MRSMAREGGTRRGRTPRALATLLFVSAVLLVSPTAALAEDDPVDGVVAPGELVLFSVQFIYSPEGCTDAVPTVVAEGWYEDAEGNRVPGSDFEPRVDYRRTSADVGFYVQADAIAGHVVVDTAVLYDCPDGSVLRVQERLYRWTIEPPSAQLPSGGALGTIGVLALGAGAFSHGQRRSPWRTNAGNTADACAGKGSSRIRDEPQHDPPRRARHRLFGRRGSRPELPRHRRWPDSRGRAPRAQRWLESLDGKNSPSRGADLSSLDPRPPQKPSGSRPSVRGKSHLTD